MHKFIRNLLWLELALLFIYGRCPAQGPVEAALTFMQSLKPSQQQLVLFPFESEERYEFHYFPIPDRKGIALDQLDSPQRSLAFALVQRCMDANTVSKVQSIIQLEVVLKRLENRKPEDHYRDPGKYYFAIFGVVGANTQWGWRLDGHHVCFSFSVEKGLLVSGTPGFMGANPAWIDSGQYKGLEVLKEERQWGFDMVNSLRPSVLREAVIADTVPYDIFTYIKRRPQIESQQGLEYAKMSPEEKEKFLGLISLYVHRYTKLLADRMLKEIQEAGLDRLRFCWMGSTTNRRGSPHYYRIQGPTLIIEYDNTQNGANHIHTVVRNLMDDFGGDLLLEHYRKEHGKP